MPTALENYMNSAKNAKSVVFCKLYTMFNQRDVRSYLNNILYISYLKRSSFTDE